MPGLWGLPSCCPACSFCTPAAPWSRCGRRRARAGVWDALRFHPACIHGCSAALCLRGEWAPKVQSRVGSLSKQQGWGRASDLLAPPACSSRATCLLGLMKLSLTTASPYTYILGPRQRAQHFVCITSLNCRSEPVTLGSGEPGLREVSSRSRPQSRTCWLQGSSGLFAVAGSADI